MQTLKMLLAMLIASAISQSLLQSWHQKQSPPKYRVADTRVPYIGGNKIQGTPPEGYENLLALWVDVKSPRNYQGDYRKLLIPNQNGVIPVAGRLVFKGNNSKYQSYEFDAAALVEKYNNPIQLSFTTKTLEGIKYVFNGHYVETASRNSTGNSINLQGIVRKFRNEREVSKTALKFTSFNILE